MAFVRSSFSAVAVVLLVVILLTTSPPSLFSGRSLLGMVHCQEGSSYLSGEIVASKECCQDCRDNDHDCFADCDDDCLLEGLTFKKKDVVHSNSFNVPNLSGPNSLTFDYANAINMRRSGVQYPQTSPIYNMGQTSPIYTTGRRYPPRYSSHHTTNYPYPPQRPVYPVAPHHGAYPRRPVPGGRPCCADCVDGDLMCFSHCEKRGCKPIALCASSGKGAYAAFCQEKCRVMVGYSLGLSLEFLPDAACRGYCAKNVQELCATNSCQDHGCYVPECADLAASKCG